MVILCVAVFGAILSQKSSVPIASSSPAQAAPSERTVVTTLEDRDVAPAVATRPSSPLDAAQNASPLSAAVPNAAPTSTLAAPSTPIAPSVPTVLAQNSPSFAAAPVGAPATTAQAPAPAQAAAPAASSSCPGNPNAIGVSRVVEIDTTGGPGFGFEHFKTHDFLREGEVVLTFDDGPWPKNTPAVLAALQAHCTKAIFFPIGLHATYEPGILKQVAAAGHAVGSHTWCHQDLSKTKGHCLVNGKRETVEYDPKDEIEKGISAVHWAVGGPTAPYFRFPALRQPPELIEYLGKRNIAVFSTDFDSFDFKMRKPEQVRQSIMAKLKKHGKGIVLMHDFQHATAEAAMNLLNDLKAGGYKVVFMKPKFPVTTLASYDDVILKQMKTSGGDGRPTSSVVRTISE
ncbi:MAG: polysaccharide deacetylase family protein [Alphaproteobacteria bacterium]|nr:MAG: polysaccharide deacetylase family protein [Alphaproteobacteria bacterium]